MTEARAACYPTIHFSLPLPCWKRTGVNFHICLQWTCCLQAFIEIVQNDKKKSPFSWTWQTFYCTRIRIQMFYLHDIQLLLVGGLLFLQPGAQLRANLGRKIWNISSFQLTELHIRLKRSRRNKAHSEKQRHIDVRNQKRYTKLRILTCLYSAMMAVVFLISDSAFSNSLLNTSFSYINEKRNILWLSDVWKPKEGFNFEKPQHSQKHCRRNHLAENIKGKKKKSGVYSN